MCTSTNPKNQRTRPSVLVSHQGNHILVDTTPEFRIQSLQNNLQQIDAVLITHTHADHIFGMDDLRRFNDLADAEIPVFGTATVLDDIRRIFNYIFMPTQPGGGKPRLTLHELEARFNLIGLSVKTLPVLHGRLPVMAFRFEDGISSFAYVTDVSQIPEDSMAQLYNLDLLILDAVRFEPHPTHFGLYPSYASSTPFGSWAFTASWSKACERCVK